MNTLLSLVKHFDDEHKSKFTAIVCLANINSPSGDMPDDVINVILQYSGDLDVSESELYILKSSLYKVRFITEYTRPADMHRPTKTFRRKSWFYYCPCCGKKFKTDSHKIAFNHLFSDGHIYRSINYSKHGNYIQKSDIRYVRNVLNMTTGDNRRIYNIKFDRFEYPDSWKYLIRAKIKKLKLNR